jgi:lactobin A/cerein 7B family class IIb bacteriocin
MLRHPSYRDWCPKRSRVRLLVRTIRDRDHGVGRKHVPFSMRWQNGLLASTSTETAMGTTENLASMRSLTDAELDHVSGGVVPLAVAAAAAVGGLAMIAIGWSEIPFGATKQDAAAALGVSHLL